MTDVASSITDALAPHQGDWMRKALDYAGVSSKDMAGYLDVEPATVSRWINGKRHPSMQTLRLWALRTGVPLHYLETGALNDENPRPDGPSGEDVRPLGFEPRTHWIRDDRVVHVDFAARRTAAA